MLLARVVVRARTMELLAKESGLDRADQELAFMTGMFSMLGILFGQPLETLIKPLQLSEALVGAVIKRQGELGRLLVLLEQAEQHEGAAVTESLAALQLSVSQFTLASLDACQWMLAISRDVQGGSHG